MNTRQENFAEIIANQTHVNLQTETHKLLKQSEVIASSPQETQTDLDVLKLQDGMRNWMTTLDTAVEEYRSHLIIMIDDVLFAKQRILHSAIFKLQQLLQAAEGSKIKTPYEFPLTPTELLSEQTEGITKQGQAAPKKRYSLSEPFLFWKPQPSTYIKYTPVP